MKFVNLTSNPIRVFGGKKITAIAMSGVIAEVKRAKEKVDQIDGIDIFSTWIYGRDHITPEADTAYIVTAEFAQAFARDLYADDPGHAKDILAHIYVPIEVGRIKNWINCSGFYQVGYQGDGK